MQTFVRRSAPCADSVRNAVLPLYRGVAFCLMAAGATAASALDVIGTIGLGTTVNLRTNVTFPSITPTVQYQTLVMDGGTLRIGDDATGQALTINATAAVLGRGYVDHWYAQGVGTTINFSGITTVPGAPACTAPCFPADGMYFRASPFDTRGLDVVNKGTFKQSGSGELTLIGPVRFVANPLSTYFFDNDRGMQARSSDARLVNNGGSFIKRSGVAASAINVPIEHNAGKFEVWNGTLVLGAGGTYQSGAFYADGLGTNPAGLIVFARSEITNPFGPPIVMDTHVFRGFTTTETGSFLIAPGATVRAAVTSPTDIGQWNQRAILQVAGTLDIAGSTVINSGHMATLGAGRIIGGAGGAFFNEANATFMGNIRESTGPGGPDWVNVTNYGQFTIDSHQSAEVGRFVNHDGVLRVDGTLSNLGTGQLHLYGGVLQGTGIINGDVFVGGGPGVAVFRPGSSPGTMTILGGFTLDPNGVLELEVEATPGGLQWDRLIVSGQILLNGRVELHVGDGVSLADLQGLDFFACTEGTGQGCNLLVEYGQDFKWAFPNRPGSDLIAGPQGFTITSLAPVPEPETYALLLVGLGLVGFAARRARRGRIG